MNVRGRRRLVTVAALGLAVAAVGAPASFAQRADLLQSPLTTNAGIPSVTDGVAESRSAVGSAESTTPSWYDTARRKADESMASSPVQERSTAGAAASDGFNWTDAGIGAGSMLGLVILAVAAAFPLLRPRKSQLTGA
jgi:hypothetical protein